MSNVSFHFFDSGAQIDNFAISQSHEVVKHLKFCVNCLNALRVLCMMFEVFLGITRSASIEASLLNQFN